MRLYLMFSFYSLKKEVHRWALRSPKSPECLCKTYKYPFVVKIHSFQKFPGGFKRQKNINF